MEMEYQLICETLQFGGEVISPMYIVQATDFKGFWLSCVRDVMLGAGSRCRKQFPQFCLEKSCSRLLLELFGQLTLSLLLTATLSLLTLLGPTRCNVGAAGRRQWAD